MSNFYSVKEVSDQREVEFLKKQGFELVNILKTYDPQFGEQSIYIMGKSSFKVIEELKEIVNLYESHGLKDDLFKKVCIEKNVDYDSVKDVKAEPNPRSGSSDWELVDCTQNEKDVKILIRNYDIKKNEE